jgi:hypothetical protein
MSGCVGCGRRLMLPPPPAAGAGPAAASRLSGQPCSSDPVLVPHSLPPPAGRSAFASAQLPASLADAGKQPGSPPTPGSAKRPASPAAAPPEAERAKPPSQPEAEGDGSSWLRPTGKPVARPLSLQAGSLAAPVLAGSARLRPSRAATDCPAQAALPEPSQSSAAWSAHAAARPSRAPACPYPDRDPDPRSVPSDGSSSGAAAGPACGSSATQLPSAPARTLGAPHTSAATRASSSAPAHIAHGSSVTYSVAPLRRQPPCCRAACARCRALSEGLCAPSEPWHLYVGTKPPTPCKAKRVPSLASHADTLRSQDMGCEKEIKKQ